jgi:hypothetical protein
MSKYFSNFLFSENLKFVPSAEESRFVSASSYSFNADVLEELKADPAEEN